MTHNLKKRKSYSNLSSQIMNSVREIYPHIFTSNSKHTKPFLYYNTCIDTIQSLFNRNDVKVELNDFLRRMRIRSSALCPPK